MVAEDSVLHAVYFTINLVGAAAMLLLLVTFSLPSRHFQQSRVLTLISLCFSRLFAVVISSLLLFSGHLTGSNPPQSLSVAQASLVVARSPLNVLTALSFILNIWFLLRSSLKHTRTHSFNWPATIAHIFLPYIVWFILVIVGAIIASSDLNLIERGPFYMYLSHDSLTKASAALCIIAILVTAFFIVSILVSLRQQGQTLSATTSNPGLISSSLPVRLVLYFVYLTVVLGLLFASFANLSPQIPDIVISSDAIIIFALFGTQKRILATWSDWIHRPSSNSTQRNSFASTTPRRPSMYPEMGSSFGHKGPLILTESVSSHHSHIMTAVSPARFSTLTEGRRFLPFGSTHAVPPPQSPQANASLSGEDQIRRWQGTTAAERFRALNAALGLSSDSNSEHSASRRSGTSQFGTFASRRRDYSGQGLLPPTPNQPARQESPFIHNIGSDLSFACAGSKTQTGSASTRLHYGVALGGEEPLHAPPHSPSPAVTIALTRDDVSIAETRMFYDDDDDFDDEKEKTSIFVVDMAMAEHDREDVKSVSIKSIPPATRTQTRSPSTASNFVDMEPLPPLSVAAFPEARSPEMVFIQTAPQSIRSPSMKSTGLASTVYHEARMGIESPPMSPPMPFIPGTATKSHSRQSSFLPISIRSNNSTQLEDLEGNFSRQQSPTLQMQAPPSSFLPKKKKSRMRISFHPLSASPRVTSPEPPTTRSGSGSVSIPAALQVNREENVITTLPPDLELGNSQAMRSSPSLHLHDQDEPARQSLIKDRDVEGEPLGPADSASRPPSFYALSTNSSSSAYHPEPMSRTSMFINSLAAALPNSLPFTSSPASPPHPPSATLREPQPQPESRPTSHFVSHSVRSSISFIQPATVTANTPQHTRTAQATVRESVDTIIGGMEDNDRGLVKSPGVSRFNVPTPISVNTTTVEDHRPHPFSPLATHTRDLPARSSTGILLSPRFNQQIQPQPPKPPQSFDLTSQVLKSKDGLMYDPNVPSPRAQHYAQNVHLHPRNSVDEDNDDVDDDVVFADMDEVEALRPSVHQQPQSQQHNSYNGPRRSMRTIVEGSTASPYSSGDDRGGGGGGGGVSSGGESRNGSLSFASRILNRRSSLTGGAGAGSAGGVKRKPVPQGFI